MAKKDKTEQDNIICSFRLVIALLGFFGFFIANAQRTSISVAVVCMVNQTYLRSIQGQSHISLDNGSSYSVSDSEETCSNEKIYRNQSRVTEETDGEFEWTKKQVGIILGAYFCGYMVSQIPAGWLALRIGGAKVMGGFLLLMSVCNLLMPSAARWNFWLLVVLRVVAGIGNGVAYPAMHAIWGQWSPPSERSTLAGIGYAGAQMGNVIALPVTGLLCQHGFDNGWPSAFYIFGGLGVLWCIMWLVVVGDKPESARFIGDKERRYITESLAGQTDQDHSKVPVPWGKIMLSLPVWAIIIANLSGDFGFYIFETCQPTYLKEVLKFDIKRNGLFAALPYLLFWAIVLTVGIFADKVRANWLSTKNTRKLCDSIGKFSAATMLIILGFLDCTHWPLAMTALVIGIGSLGFQWSGYLVNHVDLAPQYAGILMGISNCLACTSGIIGPYMVNVITQNQSQSEWQIVFGIVAVVLVAGEIFFLVFGDGELQSWAATEGQECKTGEIGTPEEVLKLRGSADGTNEICFSVRKVPAGVKCMTNKVYNV